jgi:hypothetical protein
LPEPAPRTLANVVSQLDQMDDGDTIYAAKDPHWRATSHAVVALDSYDGSEPPGTSGFSYFLEVYLAKEIIDVWRNWRGGREPTLAQMCEALIFYATHDAYLPAEPEDR